MCVDVYRMYNNVQIVNCPFNRRRCIQSEGDGRSLVVVVGGVVFATKLLPIRYVLSEAAPTDTG